MVDAVFEDESWKIRSGGDEIGRVPELPDFPDYFALLVARAAKLAPGKGGVATPADSSPVLMPGLSRTLESADARWGDASSAIEGARAFAWLTFQRPDRQSVAPLIAARSLALLAVVRARDPKAGVEDEVLLSHALGYTRHAETVARSLPPQAPLRLFESREFEKLRSDAAKPGASEATRYLALVSTASSGDFEQWKEARARLFPGNTSAAVIGTGLELDLPQQVEKTDAVFNLRDALPRAVLRELEDPNFVPSGTETLAEFDQKVTAAERARKGFIWDGPALRAAAEAPFYAALDLEAWNEWPETGEGMRLARLVRTSVPLEPATKTAARGSLLMIERTRKQLQRNGQNEAVVASEVRPLAAGLDSRPASRAALAGISADYLDDPLAAENLHRSLFATLGDFDAVQRATSALYLGDWDTVRRLVEAPATTAPEAGEILWEWYRTRAETEALDQEFARLVERFPHDWDVTNRYVSFLRDVRRFDRACLVGERWLARNPGTRQAGQFHAHIRLAHSYVLARQYGKGLALLQSMSESQPFQKAMIERGLAECLMGMGELQEAEAKIRWAYGVTPGEPEVSRIAIMIFWRQGRFDEAAKALAASVRTLSAWDLSQALEGDFAAVFEKAAPDRRSAAVAALAAQGPLRLYATWVPTGFVDLGRNDLAFEVAAQLAAALNGQEDLLVAAYGYLKKARGRDAAAEWLRGRVPPEKRNPLSVKALYAGNDDLLWELIGTPDPKDHPEWVWLFRACALALRPAENATHRAEVLDYYARPDSERYRSFGRYVVGLTDDREILRGSTNARLRSEPAYYLGVRAESEGRLRDACEWYRVAWEAPAASSAQTLAIMRLRSWSGTRQGIWRAEKERAGSSTP